MRQVLYKFEGMLGLQAMFLLFAKRLLGVPPGFKSGKYSKRGPVRPAGSKLSRKAAEGKL